jgi:hypothetical protein
MRKQFGEHNVSQSTEKDAIRAKNGTPLSSHVCKSVRLQLAKKPVTSSEYPYDPESGNPEGNVTNAHIGHQTHKSNP